LVQLFGCYRAHGNKSNTLKVSPQVLSVFH
jgi:hypothetical protein